MKRYGIAIDIGTSGLRCQALDLGTGKAVSTAITTRHPIPGMNVIDHVNHSIESGADSGNRLMIGAFNRLLPLLDIDLGEVERIAVCGNPFQLSLFQNIEIRDLAYAGKSMLDRIGVKPVKRDGAVVSASELGLEGLDGTDVIIPPAVSHEIGADAIAMLLVTGAMEEDRPCLVIDYGTNAEMALIVDGEVFTGSAAAGPALEGQQIERGMLAAPGSISDLDVDGKGWRNTVLDDGFTPRQGDLVNPSDGRVCEKGEMHGQAKGITGTGVIAAISCGIDSGLMAVPKISTPDNKAYLQEGVWLGSKDIEEAGKAIGAIRAGYLTLMREAGLWVDDVTKSYMSGAAGLYVDAHKAQNIGLVSPGSKDVIQFGNTSLVLARQLVTGTRDLDELRDFANRLRAKHCMFATSDVFKDLYSVELSLWSYGMPASAYNDMLDIYKLPHIPLRPVESRVRRMVIRDIPDVDQHEAVILDDPGVTLIGEMPDCIMCGKCVSICPEAAIQVDDSSGIPVAIVNSGRCAGTACKRCEFNCPVKTIHIRKLSVTS